MNESVSPNSSLLLYMKWNHKIFLFSSLILIADGIAVFGYIWETFEKHEIFKKIWQAGGRDVIALFSGRGTAQFFKVLETNLRSAGRKYHGANFDG